MRRLATGLAVLAIGVGVGVTVTRPPAPAPAAHQKFEIVTTVVIAPQRVDPTVTASPTPSEPGIPRTVPRVLAPRTSAASRG
jgi:hypothetical protein